ncbi:MAG: hypothetical protein IJ242_03065 [Clostridia bacterium]|nr:hypothetical protein [Clostridia bacterium]
MKKILAILLVSLLCLGLAACAMADAWKSGDTVYVHVPAKAGGGTDLYTRYLTQALTEVCPGVNFVVNNYETSEVGMATLQNAKPDGLSLGTCHGGAIVQWFTGSTNVSIKDDVKVVGLMNLGGPQAIIAGPNAPYKNFTELAEYIKANPGQVMIGCSLGGTTQMIFTSFVNAIAGDANLAMYVQCASEADKLTNVAAGSIDIANCSIPNALSYEADGRLTILGTIGPKVSTIASMSELLGNQLGEQYASGPEQGVESATWDSNYYVCVPKDTPDELCEAINEALMKACEVQSFIDGNKAMATFVAPTNYADSQAALETEWNFLDQLVGDLGLKVR